jgi:hypothetical protein
VQAPARPPIADVTFIIAMDLKFVILILKEKKNRVPKALPEF